jgi:hypothetical protein
LELHSLEKAEDGLTDILDLRVLHYELVHGDASNPEKDTGCDHGDDSWNPS